MSKPLELDNTHQAYLGFGVLFAAAFLLGLLVCYARSKQSAKELR